MGIENNLVSYKLTHDMFEEVKYVLELVYRLRQIAREKSKKTHPSNNTRIPKIYLPVNVEFQKNTPTTLNLIEDLTILEDFYIIKLSEKVAQDLIYGLQYVYKKRLSNRSSKVNNSLNDDDTPKRNNRRKKNYNLEDYIIEIPKDYFL